MDPLTAFPQLGTDGYEKASAADPTYNCVAFAAGETHRFWDPDPHGQYYWPPQAPRQYTIHALVQAFRAIGYRPCRNDAHEPELVKVAIFADGRIPKHTARQLENGRWTSKLGTSIDIEHSLRGLEGGKYGNVVQLLSKPKNSN